MNECEFINKVGEIVAAIVLGVLVGSVIAITLIHLKFGGRDERRNKDYKED